MLDILRNHRESLILKVIVGLVAMLLISFFAFDTVRDLAFSDPGVGAIAEVGGVSISRRKVDMLTESQLASMNEQFKGEIPPQYLQIIQQSVVNRLIEQELLKQEAKRLGLTTSSDEVKDSIQSNPNFQRNGAFDADFYLNKYRKFYQRTNGSSYENDLRDELAVQKVMEPFQTILSASESELKKREALNRTKYKFSVIKVRTKQLDPGELLPKEVEAEKTPEENASTAQRELANQIYAKWRSGQKIDDLLTAAKIKVRNTPDISPAGLASVFDGKEDLAGFKTLLALTPEKPFPDTYFEFKDGNYFYLVKLDARKEPEGELTAEELEKAKERYQAQVAEKVYAAWMADLRGKADIQLNP